MFYSNLSMSLSPITTLVTPTASNLSELSTRKLCGGLKGRDPGTSGEISQTIPATTSATGYQAVRVTSGLAMVCASEGLTRWRKGDGGKPKKKKKDKESAVYT